MDLPSQLTIKWLGLVAAIWIQSFAGHAYVFPNYSPALKTILNYSQLQLNNLGVAKDFGENVGLMAGYVSNKLPPWIILCIGALEGFIGYGLLWLVISQRITSVPYWMLCAALCLGANSATFFNTAVLVTNMRNFPKSRGTIVGILKGFVGLSGAIFTQIYVAFLAKDPTSLVALITIGPLSVCLATMGFVRPVHGTLVDSEEERNFSLVHIICIALAVFLLVATIVEEVVSVDVDQASKILASIMVVLLITPLFIALKPVIASFFERWRSTDLSPRFEEPLLVEEAPPILKDTLNGTASSGSLTGEMDPGVESDAETLLAVGEGAVRRKRRPRRGEDFNLRQALVKADFWLLFLTFFCGVGTGVTAINNLGQIGQAQGYKDVTMFVSLIGIWNFLGRLGGGAISEIYVRSAIPRTVFLAAAQSLMIVGHLFFAWGGRGSLHVGSTILGLCYGVHFSVMVPTASELFGLKHFGKIYNFLTMADPLGSFLFSGIIAGYLYDKEALRDLGPVGYLDEKMENKCLGAHCFRNIFIIMAAICLIGIVFSSILSWRTRSVYQSLYGGQKPQVDPSKH